MGQFGKGFLCRANLKGNIITGLTSPDSQNLMCKITHDGVNHLLKENYQILNRPNYYSGFFSFSKN